MDFIFPKNKYEDAENLFDSNIINNSNTMEDNWAPNPDDIFDSILSLDTDFLYSFDDPQKLESLEDISFRMKMEAEEYELSSKNISQSFLNTNAEVPQNGNISSTSSDSGLSSDNLDIEMSPCYEPLSPAISSPGPSISEVGDLTKHSPEHLPTNRSETKNVSLKRLEQKPKVLVQKVPQVLKLSPASVNKNKQKLNKEIKIVKLSPQMFTTPNNKTVTIQVKNSNSGAKIQANPGTLFMNNGKGSEVKKLVRLQNNANPRSILIPLSLQEVKDLKSFKIIDSSSIKTNNTKEMDEPIQTIKEELYSDSSENEGIILEDDMSCSENNFELDEETIQTKNYPKLILAPEERRLLSKEGISLPTHYPLTKSEERELKRIRRKIRNKISAQDSRKRKKEYVDGLEERVKQCTEENQTLMKRIKLLQHQNQNLVSQMKKLQTLITKGTNKTAHPTTCLMVLLLSLALVAAPNFKLGQNIKESDLEEFMGETNIQNRRNLLHDVKEQNSDILDDLNIGDILSNMDMGSIESGIQSLTEQSIFQQSKYDDKFCKKSEVVDFDVDDQNWYKTRESPFENSKLFNNLAESFQKNIKTIQTSGFNIEKNENDLFAKMYDINIKKSDVEVGATDEKISDRKLNFSHTPNFEKY